MNWALAIPEIAVACCAMAVLVFGVLRPKGSALPCTMLSLGTLLVGALLIARAPYGNAYDGLFLVDGFARFTKLLVMIGAAFSLLLSMEYNRRENLDKFEFPVLVLLATVGMMVMLSAGNLMSLYVGLELQSLAMYVLAGFARDDVRSAEAGLKYFILGSLASGLLLYGISMVYGFSGTMAFADISRAASSPGGLSAGLLVGIVFVIVGLAFKISAAPFHMWTPDVYEGAPTPVTALMSTAPKVAAIGLLLRVLLVPFGHLLPQWQMVLEIISVISMLLGSLAAIGQWNIKRLMAYSSIGHMGYALIGIVTGTQQGIRGVLIYMVTYVFMSAGTFACVIAMRRGGKAVEKIADLSGLARTDPVLAFIMAVMMFSMAGIPPLSGFFGKLFVFLAAVQAGLWALAVIGVLTSVVGAYYYLRVIKVMYADPAGEIFDRAGSAVSFVGVVSAAFTILFIVYPAPVIGAAQQAARVLFG